MQHKELGLTLPSNIKPFSNIKCYLTLKEKGEVEGGREKEREGERGEGREGERERERERERILTVTDNLFNLHQN